MTVSEPLPHFVDDLLGYLHETHPTYATLDGVHAHDDLLEDLSRQAIEGEAHALAGYLRRLDEIKPEAADRRSSGSSTACWPRTSAARMFELEEVRTWEQNPQFYADILASSLAGQALFTHAPAPERARRVLSKLRQTPRLIQAARDNIKDPPGIFVKVGIETMRGALKFIDDDLPRALVERRRPAPARRSRRRADRSVAGGRRLHRVPRNRDRAAGARARSGWAATSSSRSCGSTKASSMPVDRLLAIATRELKATQEAFKSAGGPHERRRSARGVGAHQGRAPGAGRARRRRPRSSSTSSRRSSSGRRSSRCRRASRSPSRRRRTSTAGRSPACGRRARSRAKPTRAYYYLTDVDPSWPPERQDEHLRDYNYPTLWSISIHEVYPGHFLHYQHLRRVESKARKSIMFAPASFVEGWAHYCEQMMIEAGFGRQDHGVKLGQLAEALIRLVRFIVGIRLHAEDMSVEQGVRFFRDEAFMEESERAARGRARHVRSDLSRLHASAS